MGFMSAITEVIITFTNLNKAEQKLKNKISLPYTHDSIEMILNHTSAICEADENQVQLIHSEME